MSFEIVAILAVAILFGSFIIGIALSVVKDAPHANEHTPEFIQARKFPNSCSDLVPKP